MVDLKLAVERVEAEREVTKETTNLFGWLDCIWTKETLKGTPPTYMMHRFLASDRDYAPFAKALAHDVRDPHLVLGCWQALLPKDSGAPRLSYVAAKKAPAEEALVQRMRTTLCESRRACEEMIDIVRLSGRLTDLYWEFGIEPPKEKP